jgi:hypothetical protein
MSDPIKDFFDREADFRFREETGTPEAYYPGSETKIDTPVPVRRVNAVQIEWDRNPTVKRVNGDSVEFFPISALAKAVGRTAEVVRKWIKFGYLPQSPFRSRGYTQETIDREVAGRRMYTRSMIEAVLRIFAAHGILKIKRMKWEDTPTVPAEIQRAWASIHAELVGKDIPNGSNQ